MNVESYDMMKTTFEHYKSDWFKSSISRDQLNIIYFDEHFNTIYAGWLSPRQVKYCKAIYIVLNTDEFENFNKKIYNEKVNSLTKKVKEYYIKKRLQTIEGDFEE